MVSNFSCSIGMLTAIFLVARFYRTLNSATRGKKASVTEEIKREQPYNKN
jgi:hypothetical protein